MSVGLIYAMQCESPQKQVAYVIINKHIGKMGKHVDAILVVKGGHTHF